MARRKKTSSSDLDDDLLQSSRGQAAPANAPQPPTPDPRSQTTLSTPAVGTIENTEPIVLDAVITIAEAAALKDQLLPHINRKGEIYVDGSRVQSVDTAGLQVLLAFVRTLRGHDAVVHWTGVSDSLQETAELLGVASLIGLRA
jgi:anti-anti-sigma regulatory factor